MPTNRHEPIRVEIRLEGHLDEHWSAWFGGLTVGHEADGTTTLRGSVTDQAQLYGVLAQVRDLGAPLLSLVPLDAGSDSGDGDPGGGHPSSVHRSGPAPR